MNPTIVNGSQTQDSRDRTANYELGLFIVDGTLITPVGNTVLVPLSDVPYASGTATITIPSSLYVQSLNDGNYTLGSRPVNATGSPDFVLNTVASPLVFIPTPFSSITVS